MRIEPFALDLAEPLATATGTIDRREGWLVEIEYEGVDGVGEATPLPGWTESHVDCRRALARAADVAESEGPDAALAALDARETPAARHGLTLALADARSRADGVPLYRHLGGERRVETVPVNATIGDDAPELTRAAAREAVEAGYECLKVKVGKRPVAADVGRLRAVREVAPDAELRADANGAWTPEQAADALSKFADLDVSYVEQPLPAGELAGLAALRGEVGVAVDETLAETAVEDVIDAGAADVVVLKPMVLGGPDRARAFAAGAREAGLEAVVTTTIDGALARAGAVHVAASLAPLPACGLATGDRLATDLVADPCPRRKGAVAVPDGKGNVPGVGTVDECAIR